MHKRVCLELHSVVRMKMLYKRWKTLLEDQYILYFTLKGLNTRLGIYHNTKLDYDFYLNKILPGDIVKVYFDERGVQTMENINLHVFQLKKDGEILLDKGKRNKTDRNVGLALYGVGLLFSIGLVWFYRKRMRK